MRLVRRMQFAVLRAPENTVVEPEHVEGRKAAIPVITHPITGLKAKHAVRISSFEKKPLRGQIPAMARHATRNVKWVSGM